MKWIYLVLAVAGLIGTIVLGKDVPETDFSLASWNVITALQKVLLFDTLFASFVAIVCIIFEARRLQMKTWWMFAIACFILPIAFVFPLFLFARETRLQALNAQY